MMKKLFVLTVLAVVFILDIHQITAMKRLRCEINSSSEDDESEEAAKQRRPDECVVSFAHEAAGYVLKSDALQELLSSSDLSSNEKVYGMIKMRLKMGMCCNQSPSQLATAFHWCPDQVIQNYVLPKLFLENVGDFKTKEELAAMLLSLNIQRAMIIEAMRIADQWQQEQWMVKGT